LPESFDIMGCASFLPNGGCEERGALKSTTRRRFEAYEHMMLRLAVSRSSPLSMMLRLTVSRSSPRA
jgi:hypothetical protein